MVCTGDKKVGIGSVCTKWLKAYTVSVYTVNKKKTGIDRSDTRS